MRDMNHVLDLATFYLSSVNRITVVQDGREPWVVEALHQEWKNSSTIAVRQMVDFAEFQEAEVA